MGPLGATSTPPPIADEIFSVVTELVGAEAPLAVTAWDGSRAGPTTADVTLCVRSPDAISHLVWSPGEIGLARALVGGSLVVEGDLRALLSMRSLIGEPDDDVSLSLGPRSWVRMARLARRHGVLGARPPIPSEEARLRGNPGRVGRARRAIHHHYDVGNEFYELMLGPTMVYSCGYWSDPGGDGTLEEAQLAKLELVCRKLGLAPGQRFLDVGCGWGSLVIHAAENYGVRAVGVTLSEEQAALASRRVTAAGLADQVEIRVEDFRHVTDAPFDAVASVGMFEHVAPRLVGRYFDDLLALIRPGGRLLNHAISRPDPSADPRVKPRSFMGRYVFPDTSLHEVGSVVTAMAATGFEVRDVHSLREHYARTLRAWLENLEGHRPEAEAMIGTGRAHIWRLYLAGTALGFEEHRTSVHQVLAVVPHPDGTSEMPPTRSGFDIAADQVVDLRSPRTNAATAPPQPRRDARAGT